MSSMREFLRVCSKIFAERVGQELEPFRKLFKGPIDIIEMKRGLGTLIIIIVSGN